MLKTLKRAATVVLGCAIVGSCGSEQTAGPCYHTYEDAVLHIRSVTNASTNAPISQIALTNFSVAGHPVTDLVAVLEGSMVRGIQLTGDSLLCTTECAFGTAEATYTFTAGASGYQAKPVSISASFARFVAGCPSSSDGGTVVDIALQPLP